MPRLEFKDYYEALGIDRSADESQIKAAFRKQARKHHPDVNPGDAGAEERFKEVNEAYEVLSDSDKRKLYDRYGEEWQRYKEAGYTGDEPADDARRSGADDFGTWFTGSSGGYTHTDFSSTSDHSDFFETLFGSFGGNRRGAETFTRTAPRPRRGQDIEAEVEVSFDEAFRGTKRRFDIQAEEICPTCGGTGLVRNTICPTCDGSGYIPRIKTIEVKIPAGVHSGSRVKVAGQGGAGDAGGPNGDVYLIVKVADDKRFTREGDNLRSEVDVPMFTALLGGKVQVTTPTGRVELTIPVETQQGRVFRLRGQGMPKLKKSGERGDLLARANVVLPTNLTDREKALLEELRSLRSGG
ncbi:MAG: J domain-containing protein [Thermomicrobiales bacterium]|nr:J domain-containing protein [Thermomicrobiales bacterium]MCO5221220.1 J domain-containing protein [Thermomicrobiales bacterium]